MSGNKFYCETGEVAIVGGQIDTIIAIIPATNQGVLVHKIWAGFKGKVVTNEPITIEFIRFTSDGTATTGTKQKVDVDASETLQAVFKHTYTIEPTGITVLVSFPIHPQGGFIDTLPIEAPILVHGGDFWGIRVSPDENATVMITLECEE